jgi:hypothetical protein
MSFWKIFRRNVRFSAMVMTLSLTTVVLVDIAYESFTNPEMFQQQARAHPQNFSLLQGFKTNPERKRLEEEQKQQYAASVAPQEPTT